MTNTKKTHPAYCQICGEFKHKTAGTVVLPNRKIICEDCKKDPKLTVFRVGCYWHVVGHYEIPARTLEEAIAIAEDPDSPLPPDPDYIPDTFEVDPESCEELEGEEI